MHSTGDMQFFVRRSRIIPEPPFPSQGIAGSGNEIGPSKEMAVKNVAIIGCGVAGLTSIKSCIDAGLQATCFEQQSSYGGVWNYSEDRRSNLATVHSSTVTNLSKLVTSFSDFPFPKEFPNYLPHRLMQEYLKMYAQHFDLLKCVHFNTEVVKLERSADYGETGKWVVSTRELDKPNQVATAQTFDAVMICNGHYWDQVKPDIPGLERFKGTVVHSGDYRTFHPYVGKRVVVVGCSHSGADVAVELSYHAAQVYASTRSGCYIFTRLGNRGEPPDLMWSRATLLIPSQIGMKLNPALLNNKIDCENFGLQPTGALDVQSINPICNDGFYPRIVTGSIKVKGNVKEVGDNSVVLQGGETLEHIDALVLATGFKPNYPFAKDIVKVKDDFYTSLYKHVFLPDDEWHTLSVIGAVDLAGPIPAICEMQARVVAEVLAGRCSLPSKEKMEKDIAKREHWWLNCGAPKYKFMRVTYTDYMDELGDMIGAKPNLWSMLNDPKLAYQIFFGTIVSAQYRLQGPNTWSGARKHIMSLHEQYLCPLNTRKFAPSTKTSHNSVLIFIIVIAFALLAIMLKIGR